MTPEQKADALFDANQLARIQGYLEAVLEGQAQIIAASTGQTSSEVFQSLQETAQKRTRQRLQEIGDEAKLVLGQQGVSGQ